MKFGCTLDGIYDRFGSRKSVEYGIKAEKAGFDHVWLGDHMISHGSASYCPETWTILTTIGVQTKQVMLGSAVSDPFRRHPSLMAQTAATLDQLTDGRVVLGIGAGEAMNLLPFGIGWQKPITGLREAILVIRKLWESAGPGIPERPVTFRGTVFSLENAFMQVKPTQKPYPPIYVGALSSKSREIVGELADGYIAWMETTETLREHLKEIDIAARRVGRNPEEIDCVMTFFTSVSDDVEAARNFVAAKARSALWMEGDILRRFGYDAPQSQTIQHAPVTKQYLELKDEGVKRVPWDVVDKVNVAYGTPEDCVRKYKDFMHAGVKHIMIYLDPATDIDMTLENYRRDIMPAFRDE